MNAAFLAMASSNGMTSAIMNPLHEPEMQGILAADVLMGTDKDCLRWIKRYREPAQTDTAGGEGRENRRESRRRRAS